MTPHSATLPTVLVKSVSAPSAVLCPPLVNPPNGVVDFSAGRLYRSIAVYACDAGYVLSGNLTRMCLADGTWDRQAPSCERELHSQH